MARLPGKKTLSSCSDIFGKNLYHIFDDSSPILYSAGEKDFLCAKKDFIFLTGYL